ncbi:MAG: trehalose-phosphatase [Acidimicrobiales bacterium]
MTSGVPGALDALLADPASTAVLTDFDGTLAPIVADPGSARALPRAASVLSALASNFAVVGVISGRPASFLAENLADADASVHLVGLYGLEFVDDGNVRLVPEAEPWVPVVVEGLAAAGAQAPKGLEIEDKGASLTFHWRNAPETEHWARSFAADWAQRSGLILQTGRMSVELRPPVGADKGTVVESLASGCEAACFAGDDIGDLAAFEALDRMAARGVRTIRMAVVDGESPPEIAAAADLVLRGPDEALRVLHELAHLAERRA